MSPEQARGLRTVDHRADLWSVGVIAFRCLVGRLPFEGESVGDVLVELCTGPIPIPSLITPGVPPGFDGWVARALSRDVSTRFSSAAELAESLAAVCGVTVRSAYTTGDIPVRSYPEGALGSSSATPVITPSYPSDLMRSSPTLASRESQSPGSAESRTDVPITRTPTLRRGKGSIAALLALALLLIGVGVAAFYLRGTRAGENAATAPSEPSAHPAVPVAAPHETQAPEPPPTLAPSASAGADGPDAGAAPKVPAPASQPRTPKTAVRTPPASASSGKPTPNLDIRLQR
jgi:serine/threonine-protein kinase